MGELDKKLESLGYPLDRIPKPGAIYRRVSIDGTTAYVSGAVPFDGDELLHVGKVPSQISLEQAKEAAALCAANVLRMVMDEVGTLDRVERLLRLTGYVNSEPTFSDQHKVINGASKIMLALFGDDAGLAARSAIGVAQLPLGVAVEVEAIFKLKA